MTTPLSVYLPFNRDCLGEAFVPAKSGGKPDAGRGRWEFLLVVAPLRIPGGTGSPVNPIAVF